MSLAAWMRGVFGPDEPGVDIVEKPRPRLAVVTSAPAREDFAAWRDHPITQFVMAGLKRNADEHRELWAADSWNSGEADQATLTALRERADALISMVEADYEAWCETLGVEPESGE